jgi:hypothetical protein
VAIAAGQVYTVSYYAPSGHYSTTSAYFTSARHATPLHALQNTQVSPNGVYRSGGIGLPLTGNNATNYWVDVVFEY